MAEVPDQAFWSKLKDLYFEASELTSGERQAFIDRACPPGDPLRDELIRLLRSGDERAGALDVAPTPHNLSSTPVSLSPGTSLGHYTILELIAGGGLGVVYRALDTRLKRTVAVKVLRWDMIRDGGRQRFIREAEIASSLTHPNIVAIYDIGATDGVDYIAMEYVAGRTLRELIREGALDLVASLKIALQMSDALVALHGAGIVHRDIKPTNVVVTTTGLVKVLDFGLAKKVIDQPLDVWAVGDGAGEISKPGMIIGTFAYMSPEQAEGKPVDVRSDVFSFGAVLYEMVTGRAPFVGGSDVGVLSAVLHAEPPSVHDLVPNVAPEIGAVIARCLKKDPLDRWERVQDVKVAIEQFLAQGASARAADVTRRLTIDLRVRPSIAVLPFANLSPDEDFDYFSDGLTEELINALSHLEGLRVVSRTSAFEFKGKALSIRTVGSQLGVSTILEGSVRRSGSRLRITAQLAKVSDGCQLWAGRFDRQMTDVFDIQDEIAQTIARTLEITLKEREGAPLVKRYTSDLEAYHLYLKGRFQWNKRSAEGFQKAREYYEAALGRDARYAPAYAGLADYHISVASWGLVPPEIAWPNAKAAASKALDIDDTLADAHVAMAAYRTYYEWNWAEGDREFKTARKLNPADTNLLTQYGIYLIQRSRFDEAAVEIQRAASIDPLSATVNTCVAGLAYYSRQYDRAIEVCRKALEIAPDDIELMGVLGMSYEARGSMTEAIDAYRTACALSHNHPMLLSLLAAACTRAGEAVEAGTLLGQLRATARDGYVPPIAWGWVHIAAGEAEAAFDWLEKASAAHDVMLAYVLVGPMYDSLRSYPRFPRLLEKIGMHSVNVNTRS